MRKFESVLDRVCARDLSQFQAAEILGMSERTFRRENGPAFQAILGESWTGLRRR